MFVIFHSGCLKNLNQLFGRICVQETNKILGTDNYFSAHKILCQPSNRSADLILVGQSRQEFVDNEFFGHETGLLAWKTHFIIQICESNHCQYSLPSALNQGLITIQMIIAIGLNTAPIYIIDNKAKNIEPPNHPPILHP